MHLPESYRDARYAPRQYPVMYLLDGDSSFHFATGTMHFMSEGLTGSIQIPELIVVAVPNTNRTRDLTPTHTIQRPEGDDPSLKNSGGGDAFLRFLKEELIPEIDRTYRTKPYRIIVGHSFGALLAIHALQSEPDLFQGYIAIDPSVFWDEEVLVRRAANGLKNGIGRPRTVHLLGPGQMFEQAANLGAHFEAVSARTGVALVPPERFVDQVAHAFLKAGQIDKAIGLFTFNASRNPASLNAYNSLGQAYAAKHRAALSPKP